MDRLFLDTYALVEVASGTEKGKRVLKLIKESGEVYTGSLNLYELWYLTALAKSENHADKTVLEIKSLTKTMAVDDDIAVIAARLKKTHSRKKIGAVDFVTIASAIATNAAVITGDKHFQEITEANTEII